MGDIFQLFAIFFLLTWLLFGSIFTRPNSGSDRRMAMVACALMCAILTLRSKGWDFENYLNMFNGINDAKLWAWQVEPGFLLWMKGLASIGMSFKAFLFCYSIFCVFLLWKVCSWYGFGFNISVLCYFMFHFIRGPYGQMRQAFASLIVLYALRYLRGYGRVYWLLIPFASCFHLTALSGVAAPIAIRGFLRKRWPWALIVLVIGGFAWGWAGLFEGFAMDAASFFGSTKAEYYLGLTDEKWPLWKSVDLVRIVFCSLLVALVYPISDARLSRRHQYAIQVYFAGACLFFVLALIDFRFASRVASPLLMLDFLIIAGAAQFLSRWTRLAYLILLLFMGAFYLAIEYQMLLSQGLDYHW